MRGWSQNTHRAGSDQRRNPALAHTGREESCAIAPRDRHPLVSKGSGVRVWSDEGKDMHRLGSRALRLLTATPQLGGLRAASCPVAMAPS